jgi:hypothetical protein
MRTVERLDPATSERGPATAFKILPALALLLAFGCQGGAPRRSATARAEVTAQADAAPTPSAKAAPAPGKVGHYGEPIGTTPAEALSTVLAKPRDFTGRALRLEGHVRRACSAMGCWMELADGAAADAPACRVIMKGHAFFVPTDSAGSSARVEGTLDVRRIEPAQVSHMEGEGAKFPNKAHDGSAEEIRFVASGVDLWRES